MAENIDVLEDTQRVFNTDETAFLSPKSGLILADKCESVLNVSACSDQKNVAIFVTNSLCILGNCISLNNI